MSLFRYYFQSSGNVITAPTFVDDSGASDTAAFAVTLPAGIVANDILILCCETANQAITVSNSAGGTWTEVTNSPQGTGTGGAAGATRLTVFWSRYNGTQTAPTISDSGDHQIANMTAWRGCPTSGDPFDGTPQGGVGTVNNSSTLPSVTTTQANSLVLLIIAMDLETTGVDTWTNANLTGLAEVTTTTGTAGNDGRIELAAGVMATAGATGTTSATLSDSLAQDVYMTIALKGS